MAIVKNQNYMKIGCCIKSILCSNDQFQDNSTINYPWKLWRTQYTVYVYDKLKKRKIFISLSKLYKNDYKKQKQYKISLTVFTYI